jgi:arylsulfatase A-like enzyme
VAPYDANLRAPFIVRLPGRAAAGKVCRHPVAMLDLIPTIFALAGTPPPWSLHGHDLSPILKDPDAPWPHPVMLEFFGHRFGEETDRALTGNDGLGGVPWWLSLRQGKYKYIRTLVENEIEELYDLEADPEELTNLALVPKDRATLEDLRARLEAELKRTNAGLLKNLPPPRNAKP